MLPLSVYKRVFASSPVGEYLLSRELRILDVNDALLRIIGRTREDLIGCDFFEIFPGDPDEPQTARPSLRTSLQDVLDGERPCRAERPRLFPEPALHRALRGYGSRVRPTQPSSIAASISSSTPFLTNEGEVTGICGQGLDITAKVLVEPNCARWPSATTSDCG